MIAIPTDLQGLLTVTLWPAFLVFLRIGAMSALIPAFGERAVPVRVRLGAAAAFTLIVLPSVASDVPPLPRGWQALALGGGEIAAGLFFGILIRLFVIALQIAGTIAAQSTSVSQIFGGGPGTEPQPAISNLLLTAGLALAAILGLHVHLAAYMIDGYGLVPPGRLPLPSMVAEAGVMTVGRIFGLAFSLAAPFVIASVLYNVTLGVINRAMPQLMVAFVGAPAITAASLFLLALSAPALLALWSGALTGFLAAPLGLR